jgi:hypothetical protein
MNLGNVLSAMGERESGTVSLEDAIAAYDAAIAVFISEQASYFIAGCEFQAPQKCLRLIKVYAIP